MAREITLTAGTATLTFAADPAATDTVTIGDITYTFIATPAAAYDVDVAGTRAGSIANLVAAINRSGTPGATTYHANTVANPYVTAVDNGDDTVTLTARVKGLSGVTTTTSETDITFGAATLSGTGCLADFLDDLVDYNQLRSEVIHEIVHACSEAA
ncbi:MAG: hypothetical protein AB7R40_23335 [Nitrospiraceae bacterium]